MEEKPGYCKLNEQHIRHFKKRKKSTRNMEEERRKKMEDGENQIEKESEQTLEEKELWENGERNYG